MLRRAADLSTLGGHGTLCPFLKPASSCGASGSGLTVTLPSQHCFARSDTTTGPAHVSESAATELNRESRGASESDIGRQTSAL